jgi:hypothetical protein
MPAILHRFIYATLHRYTSSRTHTPDLDKQVEIGPASNIEKASLWGKADGSIRMKRISVLAAEQVRKK